MRAKTKKRIPLLAKPEVVAAIKAAALARCCTVTDIIELAVMATPIPAPLQWASGTTARIYFVPAADVLRRMALAIPHGARSLWLHGWAAPMLHESPQQSAYRLSAAAAVQAGHATEGQGAEVTLPDGRLAVQFETVIGGTVVVWPDGHVVGP